LLLLDGIFDCKHHPVICELDMSQQLEDRFTAACKRLYDAGLKLHPQYRAAALLGMVGRYGGKEAADRILSWPAPMEGFTRLLLSGVKNLQLSLEYLVLQNPWRSLFTPAQLAVVRQRLLEVGGTLPPEDIA